MKLRQNGIVSFPIRLAVFQARGGARMKLHKIKKANRRITNDEGWNRFAKFFLKQTEYIHSTFDVGRSMFDVHQFLFRFDWPLFRPAAGFM
jgi:hypothetical protein